MYMYHWYLLLWLTVPLTLNVVEAKLAAHGATKGMVSAQKNQCMTTKDICSTMKQIADLQAFDNNFPEAISITNAAIDMLQQETTNSSRQSGSYFSNQCFLIEMYIYLGTLITQNKKHEV